MKMNGNSLQFDVRVKLNNTPSKRQSEIQKLNMQLLSLEILVNIISPWIEKQIMKPKNDKTFFLVGFELLQDHINTQKNFVKVIDSIEQ